MEPYEPRWTVASQPLKDENGVAISVLGRVEEIAFIR